MMMQREVRRALLSALKADALLIAECPRIFGQTVPALVAFPFITLGASDTVPIRASGTKGFTVTMSIHAFAKDRQVAGVTVETAEDYAGRIGKLIHDTTDKLNLIITGGHFTVRISNEQLLVDQAESGCFHYIGTASCRVLTAVALA